MIDHIHDYWPLYTQPKIEEGILVFRCDCGEENEWDAQAFFDEAHRENKVYLFDFNSAPPEKGI